MLRGEGCCSLQGTHPRSLEVLLRSDVMFTASGDSNVTLLVRAPDTGPRGRAGGVVIVVCGTKLPEARPSKLEGSFTTITGPVFRGWRTKARALSGPAQHRGPRCVQHPPLQGTGFEGKQEPPPVPGAHFAPILGSAHSKGEGEVLLKSTAGTIPTLVTRGLGVGDRRPSAASDPPAALTLWVKFPMEH